MKALPTHTSLNSFIIQPESYGATVDEGFIVGGPVGDFELLLCHGTVCVVGKMRDLILQLSKSSIYSTKPLPALKGGEDVNNSRPHHDVILTDRCQKQRIHPILYLPYNT